MQLNTRIHPKEFKEIREEKRVLRHRLSKPFKLNKTGVHLEIKKFNLMSLPFLAQRALDLNQKTDPCLKLILFNYIC